MRISDWSSDVCSSDLDGGEAEEMVPRRAGLEAPRAGEIAREHAADRALPRRLAPKWTPIRRFEGELLVLRRQDRLDIRHRSEEGRVGKACVSTCSSWWTSSH